MSDAPSHARRRTYFLAVVLIGSTLALLLHDQPWSHATSLINAADPRGAMASRLTAQVRFARLLITGMPPDGLFIEYLPDGQTIASARRFDVRGDTIDLEGCALRFDASDPATSPALRDKHISLFLPPAGAATATTLPSIPSFYQGSAPPSSEELQLWEQVFSAVQTGRGDSLGAIVQRGAVRLDLHREKHPQPAASLFNVWLYPNGSLTAAPEPLFDAQLQLLRAVHPLP